MPANNWHALLRSILTLLWPQSEDALPGPLGPVTNRWHAQELEPSHSCATSHRESRIEKGVALSLTLEIAGDYSLGETHNLLEEVRTTSGTSLAIIVAANTCKKGGEGGEAEEQGITALSLFCKEHAKSSRALEFHHTKGTGWPSRLQLLAASTSVLTRLTRLCLVSCEGVVVVIETGTVGCVKAVRCRDGGVDGAAVGGAATTSVARECAEAVVPAVPPGLNKREAQEQQELWEGC